MVSRVATQTRATTAFAYCGDEPLDGDALDRLREHRLGPVVRLSASAIGRPGDIGRAIPVLYDLGAGLLAQDAPLDPDAVLGAPLVVRVPVRPSAAQWQELLLLMRRGDVRPVLRAAFRESAETRWLRAAFIEADAGPVPMVCRRLLAGAAPGTRSHLLLMALLGRERASALDYARRVGRSPRATQVAHRRLGLPGPLRMLLWGQALWAVWRLQVRGESAKRTALHGGFPDSSAMSAALRPVLGTTPTVAAATDGVEGLIDRWSGSLRDVAFAASSARIADGAITTEIRG